MKLGLHRLSGMNWFLTSWRSADDPRTGNYSFKINPSGPPQLVLYNGTEHLWRSSSWPWEKFRGDVEYYFVQNQDEIYYNPVPLDATILSRVVLEDSGLLRWLIWHEEHKQWKEFWSVPKDSCDIYGHCGANGKCDYNTLSKFECDCLHGYEPKSPKNWKLRDGSGGCIRKRLNSSSVCGQGEGFLKVKTVKIPDSSSAVWYTATSHLECERKCISNCSCSAYASISISENESGCLIWYREMFDTRNYLGGIGKDLYVRV